jgi:hypothetical protein
MRGRHSPPRHGRAAEFERWARRPIDRSKVGRIFTDGALSRPLAFDPRRLEGDYALYDDGWPCRLSLRSQSDGGLDARFVSYDRTTGAFPARIALDAVTPHAVRLVVSNFNELTEQTYRGYAFTRGPAGLAGVTDWKGETFGFFARRHPTWTLGPQQPGPVTMADFRGSFHLWCDGTWALLELDEPDGNALHGRLHEPTGEALPVTATIDTSVPYHATIAVEGVPTVAPTLHVWMFVRPRTALAGWLDWGGTRVGCYLTRCA